MSRAHLPLFLWPASLSRGGRWRGLFLIFALTTLSGLIVFAAKMVSTPPIQADSIDKLMTLPENKIDIALVALSLAKEVYPDLDMAASLKAIDRLTKRVRQRAGGSLDPLVRLEAMNTVLFKEEGFDYDLEALAQGKIEPSFLNCVLETKKGNCFSLPVLYMAIAQRLGYPVYPVIVPSHVFLRYVGPDSKVYNIEATSWGMSYSDKSYVESFSLGKKALETGGYLKTLSYREFLGCMVQKNASNYSDIGQTEKAIAYLEKAVALDPLLADGYHSLSYNHAVLSALSEGDAALTHLKKSDVYYKNADDLGFVELSETMVWAKLQKEMGR